MSDTIYCVEKFDAFITKYSSLINKLTNELHQQYRYVLDYDDAKQEILRCLYRCLKHYQSDKSHFVTYFKVAVYRLKKRLYYSYRNAININKNSLPLTLDSSTSDDELNQIDKIQYQCLIMNNERYSNLRSQLSPFSQKIFDLFIQERHLGSWILSKRLNISRYAASKEYLKFKKELADYIGKRI